MNKRVRKKHHIFPTYKSQNDKIHRDKKMACKIGIIYNLFGDGNDGYIIVYAEERGKMPHFHLDSKDSKFHTSILLQKAAYYAHSKEEHILTKDQMKILNNHLTDPSQIEGEDLWTSACNGWCADYYNAPISCTTKPDYSNINKIYTA